VCHPESLIQENDRGTVSVVRRGGAMLVVKRSRIQERRRWIQFHSLYRGGEGTRAFRNLVLLREAGLPVPEPILALDESRFGFVIASWHVYRYLEGQACTCEDAPLIARTLKRMHDAGWVHRDPHVRNFLTHDGEAGIIDCARARPWRSGYARRYDVVLLSTCCAGAREFYPGFSASDPLYALAQWHNRWIVRWRRIKRMVRGWFGAHRHDQPGSSLLGGPGARA
jgi:tRNA A-37 threonylcarbamoyl transferase component Bud32